MKVILTDNATTCNYSQKCFNFLWPAKNLEENLLKEICSVELDFFTGCLTSVKERFVTEVIYSTTQCTRKNEM